jgi:hypothetical protein
MRVLGVHCIRSPSFAASAHRTVFEALAEAGQDVTDVKSTDAPALAIAPAIMSW